MNMYEKIELALTEGVNEVIINRREGRKSVEIVINVDIAYDNVIRKILQLLM
jgi:hypothetical protein